MRQLHPEEQGGPSETGSLNSMLPVPNATTPYWRTQLHAIDSHRTTPDLPEQCDIAIIGSGMSGASLAYHLSRMTPAGSKPPSIAMLEAREVCSGATGRNGGHVKMKTDTMLGMIEREGLEKAMEVWDLVQAQIYALKAAVEEEGLECEFEVRRSYDVFLHEPEAEKMAAKFRKCRQEGQRWTRDVDCIGREFVEQVTSLRGAAAAFSSAACSLWPYKFVSQLLASLLDKGLLNLQTHTPVTSTTIDPSTGNNTLHTPRGTLAAKKLIFATNAYTSGIASTYKGHIIPYLGTASHIIPHPEPVRPHLSNTYNITYSPTTGTDYLNARPNGSIVVGGGKWTYVQDRETWYDCWDDSKHLTSAHAHFEGLMQRHFHGWSSSGAEVESVWTGVMGATPDEWPHVGVVPGREEEGRQWIMAGFNGGGMPMIFLTAKGLAEMVVGGKTFKETGLPRVFETGQERLRA